MEISASDVQVGRWGWLQSAIRNIGVKAFWQIWWGTSVVLTVSWCLSVCLVILYKIAEEVQLSLFAHQLVYTNTLL